MSLSAAEKVRVVAGARPARRRLRRGRLPELEPEGGRALPPARRGRARARAGVRLRDDPPARVAAAEDDRRCASWSACAAPVVTFVGKTWGLHLEKVTKVSREENLAMIVDSVNLASRRGQAGDLRRRALLRRLARRPRLRARVPARGGRRRGRERDALRHQRLQPARPDRRGDGGRGRRARASGSRSASTPTTTSSAGSPTRSPRSTPAPAWCRGR